MQQHAIVRTSPKGGKFIGTCTKCGKEGLSTADFRTDECPNVRGISNADALLEILEDE